MAVAGSAGHGAMKRRRRLAAASLAALLFLLGNAWLAARYVIVEPGWARPAAALVHVPGAGSAGNLLYVVVVTRPANVIDAVRSLFDPLVEVRPAPPALRAGVGWNEYSREMSALMRQSRVVAAAVALRALGYRVVLEPAPDGTGLLAPVAVAFGDGEVAGGSAGLIMALEVYAQLRPETFPRGRLIAGTGELGVDGRVHPVDGIVQKLAASIEAGAEVFLIPRENLIDVRLDSGAIHLIPVDTFEQAVAALERLGAEE